MTYTKPIINGVCPARLSAWNQSALEGVLGRLAPVVGQLPISAVMMPWGGQTGQTRRANIELRDCLGHRVVGNFLVLVWCSSTPGGAPGGTQILTVAAGTPVRELEAGRVLLAITDAQGGLAIDVEGLAGDRWVGVTPIGGAYGSGETWT